MKYSYVLLPDYPLAESLASIKLADELGFHACYAADETWHKDMWLLFAAAATQTKNIRFGPSLSSVVLREPTLIAQSVATLDELSGGRAEAVISSGNFGLLAQYGIDWTTTRPLSRTKEAHHVIRTLLDDGTISFSGEFFTYDGLFTFARPVQERVPLMIGAMRGPKSFEAAGELSDGCHHALSYTRGAYDFAVEHFRIGAERAGKDADALSYTREAYDFAVEHIRIGAERAGKDADALDIGAWVVFATGPDSAKAKDAARAMVGIYASSMPAEQLERNGVDSAELKPIIDAIAGGDLAKGIELTSPELAERLSVSGSPAECAAKIRDEIAPSGVNHMILAITDRSLVKAFTGMDIEGVADVDAQLRLIHDEVIPAV